MEVLGIYFWPNRFGRSIECYGQDRPIGKNFKKEEFWAKNLNQSKR